MAKGVPPVNATRGAQGPRPCGSFNNAATDKLICMVLAEPHSHAPISAHIPSDRIKLGVVERAESVLLGPITTGGDARTIGNITMPG